MTYDFYFLKFAETKKLFRILNNHNIEARFVGGCVRDAIFNQKTEDFDIAVNSKIDQVIQILEQNKIKVISTGIKYNSITAIVDSVKFEITSLRKDEKCFGRDCLQISISSFEEDAKRRDFTMNALYVSEHGELFDFFDGIADLKNREVKFIGNPEKRISEDHLRIFRYFRFCAKYGDFSNRYSEIIKQFSEKLKEISIERIQQELFKILSNQNAIKIIQMMIDDLVFEKIFKPLNLSLVKKLCSKSSLELMLFLIFDFEDLMKVFRLTKDQKRKIKNFKLFQDQPILLSQYENGTEFALEIKTIKQIKYNEAVELFPGPLPNFPLTFSDLPRNIEKAGLKLKLCKKWWICSNFHKTKQDCLDFIRDLNLNL